ncbi:MAG: hypothetical protein NEHIOOID_00395 [Holosporales bacterium]
MLNFYNIIILIFLKLTMNIFKIILFLALTPLYCATEHNPFMRIGSDSSWDEKRYPLHKSVMGIVFLIFPVGF